MKTKRLLSVLLALALLFALALPGAAAETAAVSDWDALSAALAAGGEVQLAADITAPAERTSILEVPEDVTAALDLCGFTLDGGTPGLEDCVILVRGEFTLSDSSTDGTGRITGTRDGVDVLGGLFTLESGTVDGCGNYGVAAVDGVVTIAGGAVRGNDNDGVAAWGAASEIHVTGGEISSAGGGYEDDFFYGGTGVYVEDGYAEISGGVLSDNVFGCKVVGGSLVVSGGTVRGCYEVPMGDGTYGGAGVYGYRAAVRMTGGTVAGNGYAGLYADEGSVFELSGGTVADNFSYGVLLKGAGTSFRMTGGTVSGDDADPAAGTGYWSGVEVMDGSAAIEGGEVRGCLIGVDVTGGSAGMTGGTVSGSVAYGVCIPSGGFTLAGGAVSDVGCSCVYLCGEDAAFTMSGGTLSGSRGIYVPEEEKNYFGAGVELEAGSAVIDGGDIFDNSYGIRLHGGSAVMSGGTVRGSVVTDYSEELAVYFGGGGVVADGGEFTLTGGEITGNEVSGVSIFGTGSVTLAGGAVSGNGSAGVRLEEGSLALEGSPVITDNTYDLILNHDKTVAVGGPLALAEPLRVYPLDTVVRRAEKTVITAGLDGNGSAYDFFCPSYPFAVEPDENGEAAVVYALPYPDVRPRDWFSGAAEFVTYYGIMQGTDKGFEPNREMTNAMAVQMLWNCADRPERAAALPFADTAEDAWYADALRWAVETGVVDGDADAFAPNAPVTREGFALLCYRYVQSLGEGFEGLWAFRLDFPDAGAVSAEALEAVSWCVMNGIIVGMGNGTLNPQGTATRAQAAAMLQRLLEAF